MHSNKVLKISIFAILTVALLVSLSGCTSPTVSPSATPTAAPPQVLLVATTSSLQDSGLLDYILPEFETANNVDVQVTAKSSGEALKLGESGDVSALLVHSPASEKAFMDAGHGWNRTQFAYNYFVIVGPKNDPANVTGLNASNAFRKIYDTNSTFVSRGDTSGTANKEKDLWNKSGYKQPDNVTFTWYRSTGTGMGDTLRIADQLGGYTLTDKSTFLKNEKNMSLVILVDSTPDMLNVYDVIAVNQTQHPNVNYPMTKKLIDYLTSNATQDKIASYGKDTVGQQLFFPKVATY